MDTASKIEIGFLSFLTPLAVGSAAVAAYFLIVPNTMIEYPWTTSESTRKEKQDGGKRRRTRRRR